MRVGDGTDREVAPRFAAICHWLSPRTLLQEGRDHREEVNWAKRGQVGVGGGSEYETVAIETPICHNSALARYTDGRKTTDEPLTPVRGRYTISLQCASKMVKNSHRSGSQLRLVAQCPCIHKTVFIHLVEMICWLLGKHFNYILNCYYHGDDFGDV